MGGEDAQGRGHTHTHTQQFLGSLLLLLLWDGGGGRQGPRRALVDRGL